MLAFVLVGVVIAVVAVCGVEVAVAVKSSRGRPSETPGEGRVPSDHGEGWSASGPS
jgi:hypothetical protein